MYNQIKYMYVCLRATTTLEILYFALELMTFQKQKITKKLEGIIKKKKQCGPVLIE